MDFGELRKRAKDGQAFDPPTILALLDEIERLTQELDETERERVRFTDLYTDARSEIGDLRRERETLADLLRQVDVVMDGAAMMGVSSIMAPSYREDWAVVHTRVREHLALLDGGKGRVMDRGQDENDFIPPEQVDTGCPICGEPRLWCWCDGEKGGGGA